MAARLEGPTPQLFDRIGPRFPTMQRAVFANLWLTAPLVVRSLEQTPTTNAMVRSTMAPTIFQAGTKDNVLPSHARAVINFRILPGDTVASVAEHAKYAVNDTRVEVKIVGRFSAEPSAVSSTDSENFRTLERTIRSVVPDAIVAPYLIVVVTDARYYSDLSQNVFRFLPLRLTQRDLSHACTASTSGSGFVNTKQPSAPTVSSLSKQQAVDGSGRYLHMQASEHLINTREWVHEACRIRHPPARSPLWGRVA
jgi:carboxypeptidase PM20D1